MSVISGIRYLYTEPGLKYILHGSGVFGAGKCSMISYLARIVIEMSKDFLWMKYYQTVLINSKMVQYGKSDNAVKVTELLYQLSQECKDSQNDRYIGEVMDQLNTEVEAIMPLIQKYKEDVRSQSPNICVWDDFLFSLMLLFTKQITVIHIRNWEALQLSRAALLLVLHVATRGDC